MTTAPDCERWQRAGGSLSDATARKEFGLTQAEIVRADLATSDDVRAFKRRPFM